MIFLKSLWLWIRLKLNVKQGASRFTRTGRLPLNTRTINVQTMNNPKPWTMQWLTIKNQNNEISYTSTFHPFPPPLQLPTWNSMTITANVLVILHRGYRYRFVPISRTELSVSSTQPRSWLAPAFRHFKSPEICTWFGRNKEGKMKKNKKKRFSTWRGGRGGYFKVTTKRSRSETQRQRRPKEARTKGRKDQRLRRPRSKTSKTSKTSKPKTANKIKA